MLGGDIRAELRVPQCETCAGFLGVEGRRPGMADEGGEVAGIARDMETVISDADAGVLITEAARRRAEQQSGRSMARQLPLVAGCVVAGLLLTVGGGFLGHRAAPVALVVGVLVFAIAGLFLLRALDLSPATQWGEPVGEPCPGCGDHSSMREGRVAVPAANGIVALCTPECGYAEVRPDPDGSPGSRGSRKLRGGLARFTPGAQRGGTHWPTGDAR
jgi:hypothetical protein